MKIAIDANEANNKERVGIGRFAFEILTGIYKIAQSDKQHNFEILLKSKPLKDLPEPGKNWKYSVLGQGFLWTQIALPKYLYNLDLKPDLLFSTSHYAPLFTGIKTVISIMDLSYLHYPELFNKSDLYKLKYLTFASVKKAAKIITISQYSKKEIIKFYNVSPEKIIIAYPGVDGKTFKPKAKPENNYILYVGTLQPRKNIRGLIKAFSEVQKRFYTKLIIAGKKGWLYDSIFSEVKNLGLEAKVDFKDYVGNNELVHLYQNASCLVLPSFYEGFGIPVIEALACGCPVIVSGVSSLPEIIGNAGIKIDPGNIAGLTEAILTLLSDKNLRSSLVAKGLEQSKKFNWEKSAKIIYTTLIDTAGN